MKSSAGLKDLLKWKGITPTGDVNWDILLVKSVMPPSYKESDCDLLCYVTPTEKDW